ncbi:hypothetical protein J2S15_002900 [Breznakia pachnodae]|uniref:Uncharacterized protein n=1 Tax=Breznakia pachnodae TaxID=265178 RepID=A0ABU0E5H1_9FIRM|nr:hypothetical protein [Breznakia pachnodae]
MFLLNLYDFKIHHYVVNAILTTEYKYVDLIKRGDYWYAIK